MQTSKLPKEILELPLDVRAEMAMQSPFEKLVAERQREDQTILVWRNDRVVAVPANEFAAEINASKNQATPQPSSRRR